MTIWINKKKHLDPDGYDSELDEHDVRILGLWIAGRAFLDFFWVGGFVLIGSSLMWSGVFSLYLLVPQKPRLFPFHRSDTLL